MVAGGGCRIQLSSRQQGNESINRSKVARPMELKLAVADYSFPLLEWEQSLRLAHEIGMDGVDIGLFAQGSRLRPDMILENPEKSAGWQPFRGIIRVMP